MLKKLGSSLVIVGALMVGTGVINTTFIGSVHASEATKCEKCGHTPDECAKTHCKCPCQEKKGH